MNRWRRIESELWQCFRWDVCRCYGVWHLCTPYGRTFRKFTSAAEARRWADWYDTTPDMLR
jgi:hypothetical protein